MENTLSNTTPVTTDAKPGLSPHIVAALRWWIILTLPVFLVLTSVRLVANEAFLWLEYHRPGFPEDTYGFTRADRLKYGPYGVRYMTNDADISYLGDLVIDGEPAFRSKELQHMEDVKVVARIAFRVHWAITASLALAIYLLARKRATRPDLRFALSGGGIFTIGLIATIIVAAIVAWDVFFEGFHSIFFAGDSWLFYYSDTLIRLYPEQFWFDTSMVIGGLTLTGAVSASVGAWWWEHHAEKQNNGATVDPVASSQSTANSD